MTKKFRTIQNPPKVGSIDTALGKSIAQTVSSKYSKTLQQPKQVGGKHIRCDTCPLNNCIKNIEFVEYVKKEELDKLINKSDTSEIPNLLIIAVLLTAVILGISIGLLF